MVQYNSGNEQERYALDIIYAGRFWSCSQPPGFLDVMKKNIETAAKNGRLPIYVSKEGIDESDKEKLAAYRVLASQMGYEVGQYVFDRHSHIASAPIKSKK